jgi:hypothetical protein
MTTINETDEIFREIVGYENYKVSNFGNVYNIDKSKFLKQSTHKEGYLYVYFSTVKKQFLVHRLVAITFIENPDNKRCVNHINNDRKNNHVNNLRFATYEEYQMNKIKASNNTSTIKGVSFYKATQRWRSQIKKNKICQHIEYFKTIEEATQARLEVVNGEFKEFTNACEKN